MKLCRTLPAAPTLIATLVLALVSSACTFTPPSAVNSSNPSSATQSAAPPTATPAATLEVMPLPTLPADRVPRQVETPVTVELTATRQPLATGLPPTLVFQWRGGIAGRNDLWTIYAGGLIRNNKDQRFEVPAETITNLMQQLDTLGFYEFQDRYETACNDCFEYTIYAYKNGERKAVYAIDNGALPEPLMKAVQAIKDVVVPTT